MSKYTPNLAKERIVVKFKADVSEEFARDFGGMIGYGCLGRDDNGTFVYLTNDGEEETAIAKFTKYEEIVESGYRFDIEYYTRNKNLEKVIGVVMNLRDSCVEGNNNTYIKRLNDIISILGKEAARVEEKK